MKEISESDWIPAPCTKLDDSGLIECASFDSVIADRIEKTLGVKFYEDTRSGSDAECLYLEHNGFQFYLEHKTMTHWHTPTKQLILYLNETSFSREGQNSFIDFFEIERGDQGSGSFPRTDDLQPKLSHIELTDQIHYAEGVCSAITIRFNEGEIAWLGFDVYFYDAGDIREALLRLSDVEPYFDKASGERILKVGEDPHQDLEACSYYEGTWESVHIRESTVTVGYLDHTPNEWRVRIKLSGSYPDSYPVGLAGQNFEAELVSQFFKREDCSGDSSLLVKLA